MTNLLGIHQFNTQCCTIEVYPEDGLVVCIDFMMTCNQQVDCANCPMHMGYMDYLEQSERSAYA